MRNERETIKLLTRNLLHLLEQDEQIESPSVQPDNQTTNQLLATVLARLDDYNRRLTEIESRVAARFRDEQQNLSAALPHSSRERFNVEDVKVFPLFNNANKACQFEPNDKPCDDCALCSARGF